MDHGHYPGKSDPLRPEPWAQQDPQAVSQEEQQAPPEQQDPAAACWASEALRTQPSLSPVPPQQAPPQPVPPQYVLPQSAGFGFAQPPYAAPVVTGWRNNKTTLIILGAVLGVVTVVAVVGGVLFNLNRTFALHGTFVLSDISGVDLHDDGSCSGTGGYSDIAEGASVQVYDAAGKVLAVGALESSTGIELVCGFEFSVPEVPTGEEFYQVEVTHRGKITVTAEEAKAGEVALTLGG